MNLAKISFMMIVMVFVGVLAACSQAEPAVVVVTATPTATDAATATPVPTPTLEPAATAQTGSGAAPEEETTAVVYDPGTLLKGSGEGVFYLRDNGTRQHIYNWPTFLAFGFEQKDIVNVDDAALAQIPLAGELTQLVRDEAGNLYWVAYGQIWEVNAWKKIVSKSSYVGVPASSIDDSLNASYKPLSDGMLLREDDTVYYFDYAGFGSGTVVPVPAGLYEESEVMDVPDGVLDVYAQESYLQQAFAVLNDQTGAANVRQHNSLESEILGVINQGQRIPVQARTADGAWLVVAFEDQLAWLAADLVKPTLALDLLPPDTQLAALADSVSQAQPAAVTPTEQELQPIYCDTVPIRGFGKVWGDHLEVQNTLNCPYGGEQGTKAAVQYFQHGLMLWLESDSRYSADPVYVFFDDGSYQRFGDLGAADPAKVGEIPSGFYPVGDKFSKVYWEGTGVQVKERLGYATGQTEDTAGAFQQFNRGRMFWAEAVDRIFVIYDYSYYDDDDTYIRVRTWSSYEDQF